MTENPGEPDTPGASGESGEPRDSGEAEDLAAARGLDAQVYRPAEDSRLLARTAAAHLPGGVRVLDVGSGSGFVGEHLRAAVDADVVGVDVNPHACRATRDRGVPAVRGDLVSAFRADSVDVVVCNPPYLPRDPVAERDDWMEVALTGGEDGRAVVEALLGDVGRVLRPEGSVFLLVSSVTGVDAVVDRAADAGFSAVARADESYPFETLTVLELLRG